MNQSKKTKKIKDAINRARKISKESDGILESSTSFEQGIRKRPSDQIDQSLSEIRELKEVAKKTRIILTSND